MKCRDCEHARLIPGAPMFNCVNPDMQVVGKPRAVHEGRFIYPIRFDPGCARNTCRNFEQRITCQPSSVDTVRSASAMVGSRDASSTSQPDGMR